MRQDVGSNGELASLRTGPTFSIGPTFATLSTGPTFATGPAGPAFATGSNISSILNTSDVPRYSQDSTIFLKNQIVSESLRYSQICFSFISYLSSALILCGASRGIFAYNYTTAPEG